jgi:hypothetical protein
MAMVNEILYPVFLHQIMDSDFIRIQYYTQSSIYWDTTVIIVTRLWTECQRNCGLNLSRRFICSPKQPYWLHSLYNLLISGS